MPETRRDSWQVPLAPASRLRARGSACASRSTARCEGPCGRGSRRCAAGVPVQRISARPFSLSTRQYGTSIPPRNCSVAAPSPCRMAAWDPDNASLLVAAPCKLWLCVALQWDGCCLTPEFASDEIGPSAQDGQAPRCWTSSPFPLSRSLGLSRRRTIAGGFGNPFRVPISASSRASERLTPNT